jgi:Prokaryotic phospholipase A2
MLRRLSLIAVILVSAVALMGTPAGATTTTPTWQVQMNDLDYIVNTVTYANFQTMHASPPAQYSFMDWSTDGCSAGIIGGGPYNFTPACYVHDFAWRNLKRITSAYGVPMWNERNKYVADERFYNDMKIRCEAINVFIRPTCDATALIYFKAVRTVTPYASNQTLSDNPTHFSQTEQ